MSGDEELDDMLALPGDEPEENLVDVAPPTSRPMGKASRALLERSASYPVNRAAKRNTPEMLVRLLRYAAEMPVGTDCAKRSGIAYSTLRYWLQKSFEGAPGDGFDVILGATDENGTDENVIRFHDAWDLALLAGVEKVQKATMQRAMGYTEVLTYQGRVQYKYDPEKTALSRDLGLPEFVPENYLLDEFDVPIPETVWKQDPDLAMFILKAHLPKVYGNKATLDVNVRGGVLVVPMQVTDAADLNVIEDQYRKGGRSVVTFDESEGDDDAT